MKSIKKQFAIRIIMLCLLSHISNPESVFSQNNNVGIGTLTPKPSALLDVDAAPSNNKGMLVPRLTALQRLAISSPANSLLVFDTDSACFFYYNSITSNWKSLCRGSSGGIGLTGNTGAAGITGSTGAAGTGIIGTTGNTGSTGPAGLSIIGTTGNTGQNGAAGVIGFTGASGAAGVVGSTGAIGITGSTGADLGTHWTITGNAGTIDGTNFLGTTDNVPFNIRVNNQTAGRIENNIATANTFLGFQAGNSNAGAGNTAHGYQALFSNSSGTQNTAVGYQAGYSNTSAGTNGGAVAIGYQALYSNSVWNNNTAVGYKALYSLTTGANTAIGSKALNACIQCTGNTALGINALLFTDQGYYNTGTGLDALVYNTTGSDNTANGYFCLLNNTTGNNNVGLGENAGHFNAAGSGNVFLGYRAGYNETGSNKLYIANDSTNPPLIFGDFSLGKVGIGTITPAAKLEIQGAVKIVDGTQGAGKVFTSDASGLGSWQPSGAGWLTTGNTGTTAGTNYIGTNDVQDFVLKTSAVINTPLERLRVLASNGNIGIGTPAPAAQMHLWGSNGVEMRLTGDVETPSTIRFTGGGGNVTEGFVINYTNGGDTYFDNVYVGPLQTNPAIRFRTNTFGTPIDALTIAYNGNVGIGTTAPSEALQIVGNICYSGSVVACSDFRYKQNITPLTSSLSNLLKIQGVNYFWRVDEFPLNKFNKEKQIGFIAQDLEKIYPEVVLTDKEGYKSVDYSRLTPILVEAIKEQQKMIDSQKLLIEKIEKEVEILKKK